MGFDVNGQKVIKFLSSADIYPVTITEGAHGLSIINPSVTADVTFTVKTVSGDILTSIVPKQSSYNALFNTIKEITIAGTVDFRAELRS